jgi:hypothetical protein
LAASEPRKRSVKMGLAWAGTKKGTRELGARERALRRLVEPAGEAQGMCRLEPREWRAGDVSASCPLLHPAPPRPLPPLWRLHSNLTRPRPPRALKPARRPCWAPTTAESCWGGLPRLPRRRTRGGSGRGAPAAPPPGGATAYPLPVRLVFSQREDKTRVRAADERARRLSRQRRAQSAFFRSNRPRC